MAGVEISAIKKNYGNVAILHGVDVQIADGEFVVLVGPSGCGKSTLLRMIAGLETISAGEVRIAGTVVNLLPPKDRDIAMVFQNYALYPSKTVAANIGFPLKMRGESRASIERKVADAARILGLEELLKRHPRQLSGGQRQRVAMGRAIVRQPQVFLFDEPLSNLDAKLRVKMRAEIKELHQRLGATMIYVTHDQIEAMTMADRIVVMRAGRIEQVGTPIELYDRPANRFVASFIGSPSMNFMAGKLAEGSGGFRFEADNGAVVPLTSPREQPLGQPLTMGIRPEHIELSLAEAPGAFAATVAVTEPTGAETMVLARAGEDEFTVTCKGRPDIRPGATVWLKPLAEHIHLFAD
jgi:multiple sugar transport system ATP-binding protein